MLLQKSKQQRVIAEEAEEYADGAGAGEDDDDDCGILSSPSRVGIKLSLHSPGRMLEKCRSAPPPPPPKRMPPPPSACKAFTSSFIMDILFAEDTRDRY